MYAFYSTDLIVTAEAAQKIDRAIEAYSVAYNYYRSGGDITAAEFRERYRYTDVGARIIQSAVRQSMSGHDYEAGDFFSFPAPRITRRGTITIPKVGSLQAADPLPQFATPTCAYVLREPARKYGLSLKLSLGRLEPPFSLQIGGETFDEYSAAYKYWLSGHHRKVTVVARKTEKLIY